MFKLIKAAINKKLRFKILLNLLLASGFLIGVLIYMVIDSHKDDILNKVTRFELELANMTHAGLKHPMAIGDMDAVKEQLRQIKSAITGIEVYLTNADQTIVYSSHEDTVGTKLGELLVDTELTKTLINVLSTGVDPGRHFSQTISGEPYNLIFHPILNEESCYSCHAPSKKVLGSLVVRQSVAADYASIASHRNRYILAGTLGVIALVLVLNFALTRLITRRIHYLAEKAKQVADGDVDVDIEVKGEDSIEKLSSNFNTMLRRLRDKMEYAKSLQMGIGDAFFIVEPDLTITYMNDAAAGISGYQKEEVEGKMKCWSVFDTDLCGSGCSLKKSIATGEPGARIQSEMTNRQGEKIPLEGSAAALKDSSGKVLGGFKIFHDITASREAEKVLRETASREEEQRRYLEERVDDLLQVLDKAAQGNLSFRVGSTDKNDIMDRLSAKVNEMFERIGLLIKQTKVTAHVVAQEASQISAGNQDLSHRTQQQAATIEGASGTLEQMTANVSQNAANAIKVDQSARDAVTFAQEATSVVEGTVNAMNEISTSSKKIVEIVDLVNEITFQTNLLALNAAVEAARAGEHGRGFAVVATEIRNLAKRSAEAAKDIQKLIHDSLTKTEEGHKLVGKTGDRLEKITKRITAVSEAISAVSLATQEQSQSIEEVNYSVSDIGEAVQQNGVLVEQLAVASQTLASKASGLKNSTGEFTLGESDEDYTEGTNENLPDSLNTVGGQERRIMPPVKKPLSQDILHKAVMKRGIPFDESAINLDEGFKEY